MLSYQNNFLASMKSETIAMPPLISCHPIIFATTAVAIGTISLMGWAKLIRNPNRKTDCSSEKLKLKNNNPLS
jgi:hypothetical protein